MAEKKQSKKSSTKKASASSAKKKVDTKEAKSEVNVPEPNIPETGVEKAVTDTVSKNLPKVSSGTKQTMATIMPGVLAFYTLIALINVSDTYDATRAINSLNQLASAFGVNSNVDTGNTTLLWIAIAFFAASIALMGISIINVYKRTVSGWRTAFYGLLSLFAAKLFVVLALSDISGNFILWTILIGGALYALVQIKSEFK